MSEINRCPFCQSEDVKVEYAPVNPIAPPWYDGFHYFVQCKCCKANGPSGTTEEDAVKAWNKVDV